LAKPRLGADSNSDRGFICNGSLLVDRWKQYEIAFKMNERGFTRYF
jgi:hypothetical protein